MVYSKPIGGVTRLLDKFTLIHSAKFDINNNPIGARMAIIKIPDSNKLILWSSIPVSEELDEAIEKISDGKDYEIVCGIIPNTHHAMSAVGIKDKYPNLKMIGPVGITDKPELKLDYEFKREEANQIIEGSQILPELSNLQFIYLSGHKNHELVTFDKNTKNLFVADLLFNIPWNGINEDQYPGECQTRGLRGFYLGAFNPNWFLGRFFMRKLFPFKPWNQEGFSKLMELDFNSIILPHGLIVPNNGKETLNKVFSDYSI